MEPEYKIMEKGMKYKDTFNYIINVIQNGRIKPAKFIHSVTLPISLYKEMRDLSIIDLENYYIDQSIFLECKGEEVILSFYNLFMCEDMHRKIDCFLITKLLGYYPIKRTGVSKLNFDKAKIEPIKKKRKRNK